MDTSKLLYPFILAAGVLQAAGVVMNGQLNKSLVNPWLAATVSFLPIVFVFLTVLALRPLPMPSETAVREMPWWAPIGGIAGAVAVFGGLLFVGKVGAGPFNGLLITANLLTSLAIDNYGWFHMPTHRINKGRIGGAVLMVVGIALIAFR
jgi:transporter family-2 protein